MTVDEARAEFPVLERLAYLNAGTNGPLARRTIEAMAAQGRDDLEQGAAARSTTSARWRGGTRCARSSPPPCVSRWRTSR